MLICFPQCAVPAGSGAGRKIRTPLLRAVIKSSQMVNQSRRLSRPAMTPATLFGVAKSCDAHPFLHRTSPCRACTGGFRCDIMSLRALTHLSHHRRFLRDGTENSFIQQHCATRRYGATPRRGKPADMAQQDRAYCTSCFGVFVCACVTLASGRTLGTGSSGSRGHADSDFSPITL